MLAFYLSVIDDENQKSRFEQVYYAYRNQMYAVAYSVLHNVHNAEDAVHDVFVSVASRHSDILTKYNEADLKNYLLKSVKNAAISQIRKQKTRVDTEKRISNDENVAVDDSEFIEKICNHMEYTELVNTIYAMDKKYRDALYYYFVLELSLAETAKILGKNQNTVHQHITRGKKLLLSSLTNLKGVD